MAESEEEPPGPAPRLERPQFQYGADSVLAQAPLDAAGADGIRPDTLEEKFKLFRSRLVLALVEGKYPAFRRTMGGRLRLEWVQAPAEPTPRLLFVEAHRLTSFAGDCGAGETVKTFSLLPSEEAEISIKAWRKDSTTEKNASSILDSYKEETADEFEERSTSSSSGAWSSTECGTTSVATGVRGIRFHRNHREPVIHPMISGRFFASAAHGALSSRGLPLVELGAGNGDLPVEGNWGVLLPHARCSPDSLRGEQVKPLRGSSAALRPYG